MARSARARGLATTLLAVLIPLLSLSAPVRPARAQALQLQTLALPQTPVVGPWVRYRVRTQTRSRAVREYTQRVAIVGKETVDGRDGFWVELKTEGQPSGTRIERGFFVLSASTGDAPPDEESDTPARPAPGARARLERYQVLQSNGKLYEYPAEKVTELRSGGDVGTIELFEYDTEIQAVVENLGPDTLRTASRVIPALVERTRRVGADDWPVPGDTSWVNRPLLVQTVWMNSAVPITGVARSLFQVTTERVPSATRDTSSIQWEPPARPDITASVAPPPARAPAAPPAGTPPPVGTPPLAGTTQPPAGTTPPPAGATPPPGGTASPAPAAPAPAGSPPPSPAPVISWTDLMLLDLGADAVPEVTQTPEPLPDATSPAGGGSRPPGIAR